MNTEERSGQWLDDHADELIETLAALHYESFERIDPTAKRSCHLNVGVVRGGDWPSTVPGRCEIEVRMSFVPGETEASMRDEIAERVQAFVAQANGLSHKPVPMGITAGLDTRFAGLYGVPAFAWGPKGSGLHGSDEYVELDSVVEVARTLAVFAMRWCGACVEN